MSSGLSRRDKRTLIIGTSAVALIVTLSRGVPMFVAWERSERTRAASVLHDRAVLDDGRLRSAQWLDSLRARQARVAMLDSMLLRGATPSIAAAELASAITDLADRAKIRVHAMQLRADTVVRGSLTEIAVRVNAVGDIYGLMAFLRAVESDSALLAVRELAVTQSEPASPPGKPELLRLDVLVESVARVTTGKSK